MKSCLVILLGIFVGCQQTPEADLVLFNGKIYTVNDDRPFAEAIASLDGNIIAIGSNEELIVYQGEAITVIDLEGKLVLPGFIDTHTHAFWGGQRLSEINLNQSKTIGELQVRLKQWIVENEIPKGQPVWGVGPFPRAELFGELGWPAKEILDVAAPDHPVVLSRGGGHAFWINSKALEMAGVTQATAQVDGGEIVFGMDGKPTGIFKEKAQDLVTATIPHVVDMKSNFIKAMEHALSFGLTGITVMPLTEGQRGFNVLKELESRNQLDIRVNLAYAPIQLDSLIKSGTETGNGNELVTIGPIKIFMDGSLGALSAFMYEPFEDDPANSGISRYEKDDLNELVQRAHDNDFQVAIHAIGDQAATWALDAIENAQKTTGKKSLRHRIEHNTVNRIEDTDRFSELGVVASMQPHITGNQKYRERRLGVERAHRVDMWRTLLEKGAMIGWSTDWPVSSLNPIDIIYDIVTRYPEQRLTMEEAIKYYTYGSAYASHTEKTRGTLEVGKKSDMVVLSKDLFNISSEDIKKTKVVYTIVDGRIVYSDI